MAIGIQEEHEELRAAVQGWAEVRDVAGAVRTALDAEGDAIPAYWGDLAGQGLLGIHLAEEFGGQGAGLVELAVVAEELGRAAAVGPWDTTAVVAGVVAAAGGGRTGQADPARTRRRDPDRGAHRPDGGGRRVARRSVGLAGTLGDDGNLRVTGTVRPLVHGAVVTHVLTTVASTAPTAGSSSNGTTPTR